MTLADRTVPADNKEARKGDQIIQAALRVFAEHGLHGTPVPPIAAEAGVGVGTLYRYFDSKEALINAVFRDSKRRLKERLLSDLDLLHPSRSLFDTLWARLTAFAREEPDAFHFLEMQDHHSYLDPESRHQEQALLIPLGMMVVIGQRTGLLNDIMKPDLAIALFWGAFVGVFKAERLGYLTLDDDDLTRARDACWLAIANHNNKGTQSMTPTHILITGGAGAIGGQLAGQFRQHHPDARITLVDLNAEALALAADQHGAHAETCDLTDIDALPGWWQSLIDRRGPVDVLVNCAGIMDIISITGTGWERGKRLMDINFTAPMRLMDLALPAMVEARNGCVINVASMAGRVPIRGCSYYGGAKAGIGLASEIARLDLKKQGVNVITVYPGPIHSGLESHARSQVKKGPVSRYIPTGKPEVLAERIYRTFRKGGARVIYPDIYALAKQVANLNLTNRAMDFFSPQPNQ